MRKSTRKVFALLTLAGASFAQTPLYTLNGPQSGAALGTDVAGTGDLDGDGTPDLVVGCPGYATATEFGAVMVHSGRTGALIRIHGGSTGSGTHFGEQVAGGGDVDGDGIDDYMTSARDGAQHDGVLQVFSGATGATIHTITGALGARSGKVVAILGDLDGDHRAEFAGGSNQDTSDGAVRIYSGATGALLRSHIGAGPFGDLQFVTRLGDVDGDLVPDYAIGDPSGTQQATGIRTGAVELRSGASGALLRVINGSIQFNCFACEISGVGDLDLDGAADVLVHGWGSANSAGFARAYSGANGALLFEFLGECANERLGSSLSDVGDCNLDGWPDIGVGSWRGGYGRVYSGLDGSLLFEWRELPGDQSTGLQIAGVGDLDGDGRNEVLTGFARAGGYTGRVRAWPVALQPQVGTLYGAGDGSGTACPCGNSAQAQAGCRNSTGVGAELRAVGSTSVSEDSLNFHLANTKPNVLAILLSGTQTGGAGMPFADGLLVVTGTIKRQLRVSNCSPVISFGPGLAAVAQWPAGTTLYFQGWFRDLGGPCGSGANTSNGIILTFTP